MSETSLAEKLRESIARRFPWAFSDPGFIPVVVLEDNELSRFHKLEAENRKKRSDLVGSLIETLDQEQREQLSTTLLNEESIRELRMRLGERLA